MIELFITGVAAGAFVTDWLHWQDSWWNERLGRSRWRRANLPVGGVVAATAALVLREPDLYGLAAGAALSAVGWRFIDPLAPVSSADA